MNTSCNVVYKVTGYSNVTTMVVKPISYSSNSLLSAQTNTTDSVIKTKLDSWYQNNFTNYTSYLADTTFCNDRSITDGSGYLTSSSTNYDVYNRIEIKKIPSLKCSQENDRFKVSNESAKLNYSIGLILADEVALAGGKSGSANSNYYLYNGKNFWTLSPSYFYSSNSNAFVWYVISSGSLFPWPLVTSFNGVRPVINLKQNVTIAKGDGSALNPFSIG